MELEMKWAQNGKWNIDFFLLENKILGPHPKFSLGWKLGQKVFEFVSNRQIICFCCGEYLQRKKRHGWLLISTLLLLLLMLLLLLWRVCRILFALCEGMWPYIFPETWNKKYHCCSTILQNIPIFGIFRKVWRHSRNKNHDIPGKRKKLTC